MCIKSILDFSHLRTSCAPAVGLGDFKKLKPENDAKQPITRIICDVDSLLGLRHIRHSPNVIYPGNVKRNAWDAIFVLLKYMFEEKKEKTCPSWMLTIHGSQNFRLYNNWSLII